MSRRRVSVAVVVTLALVAATTTLSAVFAYAGYRALRAQKWDALRNEQTILVDQIAAALSLPVWNFDRDQIDRIISGAMLDDDVAGIVVRLADRRTTIHARTRDAEWHALPTDQALPTGGLLTESRTVTSGAGDDLATVEVLVTPRFVEAALGRSLLAMAGAAVGLDVLLILGLSLLLQWLVMGPLREIERYAATVGTDDRHSRQIVGRTFRGELERLRLSIETMIGMLDARYLALERSQEGLRASEALLRALSDNLPHAMVYQVIRGADGVMRFTYVSAGVTRLHGVSANDVLRDPTVIYRQLLKEDRALLQQAEQHAFETRTVFDVVTRIRRPDGSVRWVRQASAPRQLADGRVAWEGIESDVTDLKEMEQAVEASESLLRRANRALRTISFCNQASVRALTEQDLLDETCRGIVEIGGYVVAWVGLAEHDEARTVRPAAQAGSNQSFLDAMHVSWADGPRGRGPAGTAIRTGRPQLQRDLASDENVAPWRDRIIQGGFQVALALPLIADGETFGALSIMSAEASAFDDQEIQLLTELSDDLAHGMRALRTRADRERAEDALRLSEDRFRSAMRHSPIGMALVAPDGRWFEPNPALSAIVGYTRDELMQMTFAQLTHPDDLPQDLEAQGRMLARRLETYQAEKRYLHKDGRVVWVQVNVSPVWGEGEGEGPRYFVTQIQDITDRKRSAAALLELNARYARHEAALTTLTRSHVGAVDDLGAVLRRITEVVAPTLGVARVSVWRRRDGAGALVCDDLFDAAAGVHTAGLVLSADDSPRYFRALDDADVVTASSPLTDPRTRDLVDRYLRVYGVTSVLDAPIRGQIGTVGVLKCEHVGVAHRWTPDEQTFAVAVANLIAALVAQSDRERVEERLRQAQKFQAIGQLAGGIAHDFNNILTVILGKATTIAQDGRLPKEIHAAAVDVTESGERAAALTRQLLTFSRRQTLQVRTVDLNVIVAKLARMLHPILGEDVALDFAYSPAPVPVRVDPGMIDQVLLNLAVNARDAMPHGGRLTMVIAPVELGPEAIGHAGARVGWFARLEVRDTGTGIAPEHVPHIFEPFFTTKDVGKGTGLGLATTYGIVQQHGGWVDVDSTVGQGTTFRVFLPLGDPTDRADETRPAEPAARATPGSGTILVVEDQTDVRALVVDVLTTHGYTALEAPSGPRAIEIWREHEGRVDLLLTDMVMPDGMNGLELARRLRESQPGLKVIYTSGYLAEVNSDELQVGEGARYLAKPFSLSELVRVVRQSLEPQSTEHPV